MRTYLYISYNCNCSCFFCASDDTNISRNKNEFDFAEAKKFLLSSPDKKDLVISGGEPTIHKDFIKIVRFAKQYYSHIGLMTNGIKFADMDFLQETIDAGIDRISIPFYSSDEHVHNYLVGNSHAFEEITQGMNNINALLVNKDIYVQIKLLLAKFTYKTNPFTLDYINKNYPNIKHISLSGFHISNKALQHSEQCVINFNESRSYNDMVIQKLIEYNYKYQVCEIPLCAFSEETIYSLLKHNRIVHIDDTYLKRPDSKSWVVASKVYKPKECDLCTLNNLCPKIQEKNASLFDHGVRPIRGCNSYQIRQQ